MFYFFTDLGEIANRLTRHTPKQRKKSLTIDIDLPLPSNLVLMLFDSAKKNLSKYGTISDSIPAATGALCRLSLAERSNRLAVLSELMSTRLKTRRKVMNIFF